MGRACALLAGFSSERPEQGLGALASAAGIPKSTAHRLLGALEAAGFVQRDPASRCYSPGLGLARLGAIAVTRLDLGQAAAVPMRQLAADLEEAAYLARLLGPEVLYVAVIESRSTVRLTAQVGMTLPLHSTATGKVLLASLPAREVAALVARPLARLTPQTLTDPARLVEELQRVRERGWAMSYEEHELGVCSIATPVRDYTGSVVAALAVSGPSYRLPPEKLLGFLSRLRASTRRISAQLGAGIVEEIAEPAG